MFPGGLRVWIARGYMAEMTVRGDETALTGNPAICDPLEIADRRFCVPTSRRVCSSGCRVNAASEIYATVVTIRHLPCRNLIALFLRCVRINPRPGPESTSYPG